VEWIGGRALREFDYGFDRRGGVAVMHLLERCEIVEVMEIDEVVEKHRVIERLLVEVEALKPR
jgi:hypothetical protein